jgi:hypothetical protein
MFVDPADDVRLPPPPAEAGEYTQRGAAGSGLWRVSWPLAKFRATLEDLTITGFPERSRATRADLEALEYVHRSTHDRVYLLRRDRRDGGPERDGLYFVPMELSTLLWHVQRLGWPIRQVER